MLESRHILFQIFSSFIINEIQEHTTNLRDLRNVELHDDTFKMFNQVWDETLLVPDSDLDEFVLESVYERQVKKSTLMKNALSSYHKNFF